MTDLVSAMRMAVMAPLFDVLPNWDSAGARASCRRGRPSTFLPPRRRVSQSAGKNPLTAAAPFLEILPSKLRSGFPPLHSRRAPVSSAAAFPP
jgi:hypothetical protein